MQWTNLVSLKPQIKEHDVCSRTFLCLLNTYDNFDNFPNFNIRFDHTTGFGFGTVAKQSSSYSFTYQSKVHTLDRPVIPGIYACLYIDKDHDTAQVATMDGKSEQLLDITPTPKEVKELILNSPILKKSADPIEHEVAC
jgi:hypothetical protein